ncbi:MAG: serine protease [Desulfobacterales bacterium]|nr:serine protease [Desulfobacterales bacterium]
MEHSKDFPGTLDQVEKAVVKVAKKQGQGILVDNCCVITAAHCISWDTDGGMAMGDFYIEEIEMMGRNFKLRPIAVEAVADIAVLGPLDSQAAYEEVEDFCEACRKITPVKICTAEFEPHKDFKAYVFTHDKGWIQATAHHYLSVYPTLWITTEKQIDGGTSGGPVVNEKGELLGVVSFNSINIDECTGQIPRASLALPSWILQTILQPDSFFIG